VLQAIMSLDLPGSLCVLDRSIAPPTSDAVVFHVVGLPHLLFSAYAVDGGTLVVQQVG
jgi:hypothetical protein